jgi:peroxiredoxin
MLLPIRFFPAILAFVAGAACASSPAPDFTLSDTHGKPVKLSDYRGQYVVLEWTNPECPFVRKHYNSGNMQGLQKEWGARNVVWLAVNSTSQSNYEYKTPRQLGEWMSAEDAAPTAALVDGTSATGRAYGAKTTPHMFVVDPSGNVIYSGAIDDRRTSNPADAKAANNYVRAALTEALAGKPVSVANTTPYGCSVKY